MTIEQHVINYLSKALEEDVLGERPEHEDAYDHYVLVEKTGAGGSKFLASATIAVQCYSAISLEDATNRNQQVKMLMQELADLECVTSCTINSDYNYTDTQKRFYRYQAVYNINYYQED